MKLSALFLFITALSVCRITMADSFEEEFSTNIVMLDSAGTIKWSAPLSDLIKDIGINAGEFSSIIPTDDAGFIVAGGLFFDTSGEDWTRESPSIIKINSTGKSVWEVEFPDGEEGRVLSIFRTKDNGYFFCGKVFLGKLSASGQIEWKKALNDDDHIRFDGSCFMDETADNEFFVAGDKWVMKMDFKGAEVWHKQLDFSPWKKPDGRSKNGTRVVSFYRHKVAGIVAQSDKSVLVYGFHTGNDNTILKTYLDTNGVHNKSDVLHYEGIDGKYCGIKILSKVPRFLNYRENEAALINKLDSSGTVLWTYDFYSLPKSDIDGVISSITETPNEGVLISLRTMTGCNIDGAIVKLDAGGSLRMMSIFDDNNMDEITAVAESAKGEYLAAVTYYPANILDGCGDLDK